MNEYLWFVLFYFLGIFLLIKTLDSKMPAIYGIPYYIMTIYFNVDLSNSLWTNIFHFINNIIVFIGITIGNQVISIFFTFVIFFMVVITQCILAVYIDKIFNMKIKKGI